MAKKLKDGTYYWVRQEIRRDGEGKSVHPHWEPMLHDKGRFYQAGLSERHPGFPPSCLDEIGEPIERRAKRTVRKGWMTTTIDPVKNRAEAAYHEIHPTRSAAAGRDFRHSLPVPVEISWENADFNLANGYARERAKALREKIKKF